MKLLRATFLVFLASGGAALWASPRRGQQFVLFDVTFPFSKRDADTSTPSKSHYYVKGAALNPKRPRDWNAPCLYNLSYSRLIINSAAFS